MHFSTTAGLVLAAVASMTLASSISNPPNFSPPTLPPTLTPLFTAKIHAGNVSKPIPRLLGGYQLVYPLMGGTITGPALNGTIHSGASTPHVTDDGVFAYSIRNYYGTTTDGEDFFIEQRGVGEWTKEQTWMAITIGGEYEYLRHVFLLAQNDHDAVTHRGKVTVYGVNMQDQFSYLK